MTNSNLFILIVAGACGVVLAVFVSLGCFGLGEMFRSPKSAFSALAEDSRLSEAVRRRLGDETCNKIERCEKCGKIYDDAICWTICPHGPLGFAPDSYCPKCDTVELVHGKCQHQLQAETTKVCDECAGTGCDHPESAAYRNSEYGTDCPKCKGTGSLALK